jgi:hypothetical protein
VVDAASEEEEEVETKVLLPVLTDLLLPPTKVLQLVVPPVEDVVLDPVPETTMPTKPPGNISLLFTLFYLRPSLCFSSIVFIFIIL